MPSCLMFRLCLLQAEETADQKCIKKHEDICLKPIHAASYMLDPKHAGKSRDQQGLWCHHDCVSPPWPGWGRSLAKYTSKQGLWDGDAIWQSYQHYKWNVFIKPFLHHLISQSAVQKPSLKPQTASNVGVEARWLGKKSLVRPEPRKKPREEPGYGVASPLLAVPGGDYNRTWPRCSNVHRWPAGSNNNNHGGIISSDT